MICNLSKTQFAYAGGKLGKGMECHEYEYVHRQQLSSHLYDGIFIIVILDKIQRNIGLWPKKMLSFL